MTEWREHPRDSWSKRLANAVDLTLGLMGEQG